MSEAALRAEFALLVECCRRNFSTFPAELSVEVPSGLDWDAVVALSRRHRVQGLVWNALAQQADRLTAHAKDALSGDARSIAATNLAIAGECRELHQCFEQANIPLLFIKGLTVGALAYRSPLLKMGWDIDLLIDPGDLDAAAELLVGRGFTLRIPSKLIELRTWHRRSKESVWTRDGSVHVELHTSLADNDRLIPSINVHAPRQMVEVAPAISLPTLAEEELFAYLAVHGASSAWFRLKWISDFAALLHGRSAQEIERLYRRSQRLGAGRAAGQALLLADKLFESLSPIPALRKELASDRSTSRLCQAALRMMTKGEDEPTEQRFGTLAIHWTQFLLAPSLDYKMSEARRQAGLLMRHLQ